MSGEPGPTMAAMWPQILPEILQISCVNKTKVFLRSLLTINNNPPAKEAKTDTFLFSKILDLVNDY